LHDVGHDRGTDYLVLELIEGESLAARIARGPLPVKDLVRIGGEIAAALDKAHRAGIVHRDLKPGNVMLTKSGAKLLDFGLAKPQAGPLAAAIHGAPTQTGPASPITQQGALVGTFQYMSPEQVEGHEADARSDIFALGAVLYEMATGKRAFDGKSQISVASAILEKDPEPISVAQPMSPPALDHVVRTCLAKDPEMRYQTAHDVALELKWISESGSQVTEGLGLPHARHRRRERLLWMAAVLILLAVAAAAFYFARHRKPPELLQSSILPPPNTIFDIHSTGMLSGSFALSPDGQSIVFGADSADGSHLYVRNLKSTEARELPNSLGGSYPFWSPDSKSIGIFEKGSIYVVDLDGSSPVQVAAASDGRGAAWASDGNIYFTPGTSGPVFRVSHGGGTPQQVTKLEAGVQDTHRWPLLLPDGKHLVYFAASHSNPNTQTTGLFWASLDGRESHFLVRSSGNAEFAGGYLLYPRGDALMAQRFDASTGKLSGDPVLVTQGVELDTGTWRASFTADPSGDKLVYVGGSAVNRTYLSLLDAAGKPVCQVAGPDTPQSIRFAPKGNELLLVAGLPNSDVWIIDLDRNVTSHFSFGNDHQSAVWSPDGRQIAYCERNTGLFQLFVKDAGGVAPARQLLQSDTNDCPADWSPDGKTLAFVRTTASGTGIWFLPMEGGAKPYPLFDDNPTGGFFIYPAFSPDGNWLAYTSNQSGNGVFVVSFPGRKGKWQISSVAGELPLWSKNGRTLYYVADNGALIEVPVDGT
jgi:serine/threonine protein kinase